MLVLALMCWHFWLTAETVPVQAETHHATYIRNAAFVVQQRLAELPLPQALAGLQHAAGDAKGGCQLQGLSHYDLQKARQAWQRLITERLEYLRQVLQSALLGRANTSFA